MCDRHGQHNGCPYSSTLSAQRTPFFMLHIEHLYCFYFLVRNDGAMETTPLFPQFLFACPPLRIRGYTAAIKMIMIIYERTLQVFHEACKHPILDRFDCLGPQGQRSERNIFALAAVGGPCARPINATEQSHEHVEMPPGCGSPSPTLPHEGRGAFRHLSVRADTGLLPLPLRERGRRKLGASCDCPDHATSALSARASVMLSPMKVRGAQLAPLTERITVGAAPRGE